MKPLTITQRLNIIRIDQASISLLELMSTNPASNDYQFALHALLGNFKSSVVGCGCIRPTSCGLCRTTVEEEMHWQEKRDEMLDGIIDAAREEYD